MPARRQKRCERSARQRAEQSNRLRQHPGLVPRRSSSAWQKSQDSGTTDETACPTKLHQQVASVVGQAVSRTRSYGVILSATGETAEGRDPLAALQEIEQEDPYRLFA